MKSVAKREVKARKATIRNAADLYSFCQRTLQVNSGACCHRKRWFFLVKEEDVTATVASSELKTLKGTRAIHSIRTTSQGNLVSRKLTCFCEPCLEFKSSECRSLRHSGKWIRQQIHTSEPTTQPRRKKKQSAADRKVIL